MLAEAPTGALRAQSRSSSAAAPQRPPRFGRIKINRVKLSLFVSGPLDAEWTADDDEVDHGHELHGAQVSLRRCFIWNIEQF